MNGNTTHICLALAAVGLMMGGSGCALPAIEGVFDSRDFAVFDDTPEGRGAVDDEVLLVFADVDADRMRTVSVDLKALSTLPVGEELAVGDGAAYDDVRPNIDVVEGTLVTTEIPGNGTLYSVGDDAVRAVSVGGTVTLDVNEGEDVAGEFHVDLSDGGYLEGRFRAVD